MFLRILVILIFAKCAWVRARNDQLVSVRRQGELEDTLQCISTDVTKAVVWDTPIEEKYARNITATFPNTKYGHFWSKLKVNSLKSVYGPVTDSRWESFPTVFTHGPKFILLQRMNVSGTFQIPISVRTEGQANIYVCTGIEDPSQNMCYWIILGGWHGTKSVLRKCKPEEIQKDFKGPLKNCGTNLHENSNNILIETNFVHFVIQFDIVNQTISLTVLGENNPFLSYSDKHYDGNVNFESVWVNSARNAFWKIHDYDYHSVGVGSNALIASNTSMFCISMYVALCKECTLFLDMISSINVVSTEYTYNKSVVWQRITINSTDTAHWYELYSTIKSPLSGSASVAFDNIVFSSNCFNNEFKYSTLKLNPGDLKKATCKFLMNEGKITSNSVTNVTKLDLSCPLGTIGPTCVNCSDLSNQCKYSQICQYQNNDKICYCSAGYMNERCSNTCPVNKYGVNCQYECGRCKNVTCNLFTIDYEIADCNKKSSEVTEVGFISNSTEIYLHWEQQKNKNGPILGYDVHIKHLWYKECNNTRNKSIEFTKFVRGNNVSFEGLAPYSVYYVSISTLNHTSVHYLMADTKASDILMAEGYSFSIRATARNLMMELATNCSFIFSPYSTHNWITCSAPNCSNTNKISSNGTSRNWTMLDLTPFTEYIFYSKVENRFKGYLQLPNINFTTLADVPNGVRNFDWYGISRDYIYFRFNAPYPPNGIIEQYRIDVSVLEGNKFKYLYTIYRVTYSCSIWTSMQCFSFTPYVHGAIHNFQLSAKNKNISGWSDGTNLEVHAINGRPDPPKNLIVTWDEANNQVLQWKHPNKMNGILSNFLINLGETQFPYSPPKYNLTYSFKINYKPETDAIRGYLSPAAVKVAIRCVNIDNKTSDVETIFAYYPPPIPEFAESPTFKMLANQTVSIDIPKILKQGGSSSVYIIVEKVKHFEDPKPSKSEIKLIKDWIGLTPEFTSWIAKEYTLTPETDTIHAVIGNGDTSFSTRTDENITNWSTQSGNINNIYVVALNEKREFSRLNVYILKINSTNDEFRLYFLLLLLIIPIVLLIFYACKYNPCMRNTSGSTAEKLQTNPLCSKRVPLNGLEDYVKESIANGELARQHELFFQDDKSSNEYEEILESSTTRDTHIVEYDARDRLAKCLTSNGETLDYTNARYIKGFDCSKAYLVMEDPTSHTINGYWRVVWKENVTHIIMLAFSLENEQCWPNYRETVNYGGVSVQHVSTEVFADYEIRHFIIEQSDEKREVKQLHFRTWPDQGVPLYPQSLVPFLKMILPYSHGSAPILIHSSADVGKTSTLILIDICLRMASNFGYVNIFYKQELLWEQHNMIGTLAQYKLAHLVILECLYSPVTGITCDDNFENAMKKMIQGHLQSHMRYIEKSVWQENALSVNKHVDRQAYPDKDRFSGKFVEDYGIISLPRYPASDETSSYINAAAVDGFRSPKRFIATQDPLPNTVGDFWRLVLNHDVSVIVCLQKIDKNDPTCCQFWPNKILTVVKVTPIIELHYVHYVQTKNWDQFEVSSVSLHYKEEQRKITIITLNDWNQVESCTPNKQALLAVWHEMNYRCRNEDKIVITCRNGIHVSGLYLAMCFTLEKIKLEQMCDVCQAVRIIRRSRRQFVQSKEQFIGLHEIVSLYLNDFKTYSNFTTRK